MNHTATYSAQDNKIRITPAHRLDADEYARVKAAGFAWAPKQGIFVAPMWTPAREDLALEMCGEIEDEDSSAEERAAERAERFEGYQENRTRDAESARRAVAGIADNIPFGQPILIGHHSERHARKDAERIENGMRRAVRMWETAEYWQRRARASLRHAERKERPDVRQRRIKGLEADLRKQLKYLEDAEAALKLWTKEGLTIDQARTIAGFRHYGLTVTHTNADGTPAQYGWSAYDVLRPDGERYKACPAFTLEQVQEAARQAFPRTIAHQSRWRDHITNRLTYERAMLADQGGTAADKHAFEIGGQILRRGQWFTIIKVNAQSVSVAGHFASTVGHDEIQDYRAPSAERAAAVKKATKTPPLCNYPGEGFKHMTRAELDAEHCRKWSDFSKTKRIAETDTHGAHRVQQTKGDNQPYWGNTVGVYITDAKRTDPPKKDSEPTPADLFKRERAEPQPIHKPAEQAPQAQEFAAMKEALRAGVQVVTAPQLFPTPAPLAARMVDLAQIPAGALVLEPSAGTGAILEAMPGLMPFGATRQTWAHVHAVEKMQALADRLDKSGLAAAVYCADFTQWQTQERYDRILMNPPFANGADIEHIMRASAFLKDGGRLVAICANGPRQRERLMPLAEHWEDLPAGTFKEQGTNVNTALLVIQN